MGDAGPFVRADQQEAADGHGSAGDAAGRHRPGRHHARRRRAELAGEAGLGSAGQRLSGRRRWLWWSALGLIVAGALGLRLWYLFAWRHPMEIAGDAFYYHHAANLLVDGRGWPNPYDLINDDRYVPDAQHPPMTSLLLAIPSLFGLRGFLDHQIFLCGIGALSVLVVGLAGRRIAGPATGLVAATIAAVYPGMWLPDPLVMSETPGILACALVMLACYRLWDRRRPIDVVWVALALAAAMLTRAELALLAILLVTPLVLRLPALSWRRRLGYLGIAAGVSAAAISPWVGYNLSRFEEPEFISSGLGVTLAVTHCDATYHGDFIGWWSLPCADTLVPDPPTEVSQRDRAFREAALDYIGDNSDRLPVVSAARLGRTWGVFRPWQQARLDTIEARPEEITKVAIVSLWCLAPLGAVGVGLAWRRRRPVLPLLATPLVLSVTSALVYGNTRFRAVAEPSVVLMASITIGAVVTAAASSARRGRGPAPDEASFPPFPTTDPHAPVPPTTTGSPADASTTATRPLRLT
ncbi:MAG: glycosyltransferase family 39 protein [Frankia sp.]|nr:glycosyltransferase family 39 protein [Frankia sp.]